MSYLVFARKFRPQTFGEILGQDAIVTTLKNSIEKGRIAQSFLFTGSRGVGKTSAARILAKALNCEKGPPPEPCNKCSICEEITDGRSLDILEIDGASNRGIDEIRSLRESVKFKPVRGRYKVYIIDEVHMLTGEAFNALLKTLEEPPEHVKFVFATTEAHKVPLTILSRCQRFNFRRIPTGAIAKKLEGIAQEEKIKITPAALFLIAKQAEGSLRDGESLLDQMASFAEGALTEEGVALSLGLAAEEARFALLSALKNRDGKSAIGLINRIAEEGKDLVQLARGLLETFRDVLVLQTAKEADELIEGTEERLEKLREFEKQFSRDELFFALAILQQLARDIRWSESPRFLLETALLKIAWRANLRSLDEILQELKALEKTSPHAAGPRADRSQDSRGKGSGEKPASSTSFEPASERTAPLKKKDNLTGQIMGEAASAIQHVPRPQLKPERAQAADELSTSGDPRPRAAAVSVTLSDIGRIWPDLLERVKAVKMSCGTFLAEAEPVDVTEGIVVFGLPSEFKFHKEALEKQDNKDLIRKMLRELIGVEAGVAFVITEAASEVREVQKPPETAGRSEDSGIITSALNVFEGSRIIHEE